MSVERGNTVIKECMRCGEVQPISYIGKVLINFVCDPCRRDESHWDFNKRRSNAVSITVEHMQSQMATDNTYHDPEDDPEDSSSTIEPANLRFGKIQSEESGSLLPHQHRNHNVLGNYCWNCKIRISNRIPGWSSGNKDKQAYRVIWADSSKDDSGKCNECLRQDCKFPVHTDHYKEKSKRDM